MGGNSSKLNVKIDFKEHLKSQKEVIFDQEVTKGARPIRGHARQSGQRESMVLHINHETIEGHQAIKPILNSESLHSQAIIRNPKLPQKAFEMKTKLLDNRTLAQYDRYPYTCIGMLHVNFENRRKRGTAFLISSNWLLTCAHNFYDRAERKMGTQATFTLALH